MGGLRATTNHGMKLSGYEHLVFFFLDIILSIYIYFFIYGFLQNSQVYMPIHVQNDHWVCGELDLLQWNLTIYDSLIGHTSDERMSGVLRTLTDHLYDILLYAGYWRFSRRRCNATSLTWTRRLANDIPQQLPASGDCGVMTCMYIEHLCLQKPFSFDGSHCTAFRLHMAASLYKGHLV